MHYLALFFYQGHRRTNKDKILTYFIKGETMRERKAKQYLNTIKFNKGRAQRKLIKCLALIFIINLTGCASVFMDQVAVPNSEQKIIVGHDGGPFEKAWVLDKDGYHTLKIKR
jgi:hypothetical protein